MRKESKLSRVPAQDEESVFPPLPFMGMKFDVTAPKSMMNEIEMMWVKFVPSFNKLSQNAKEYKTVPKFRKAVRDAYQKNKFMLSASDENWVFNWSLAQRTLEINVQTKMSKAATRRLAAFAFGVMLYDTIRPELRRFFARKVKQDKPPLQGIQKYLKFLKDGMQLGRPRAAFGWGFMMHLEQVSKKFYGHPLHALVGEVLFDQKDFIPKADVGYEVFKVDEYAPLAYQYDEARFDKILAQNSLRSTVAGMSIQDALDATGIAPFMNALEKLVTKEVLDPNARNHISVMQGLGLTSPSQLNPRLFRYSVSASNSEIAFTLSYNGRTLANGTRSQLTKNTHYNAFLKVQESFQGLGAGMHMTASQIETAMRMGRKKIRVTAALDGGWKTWNKFGFESDSPMSGKVGGLTDGELYLQKSIEAKLFEMGDVDRQQLVQSVLGRLIQRNGMSFYGEASESVNVNPPLPTDRVADVKKILKKVIDAHGSYSSALQRVLSVMGLPSNANRSNRDYESLTSVSVLQQQKVHDYFLINNPSSSFATQFRREWGYPPATSSRPTINASLEAQVKGLIERWGWFDGQPFSGSDVVALMKSPRFDVVHGYKNLPELMAMMKAEGIADNNSTLIAYKLTRNTQYMQDLMEVEGFSEAWENQPYNPSWGGTLDLSEGKYSLGVLAMDNYRKMKIAKKPERANDPDFRRTRRASFDGLKLDPDILERFSTMEDSEAGGGFSRVDLALMEQALRMAQNQRKDIKAQMKAEQGEAITRIASRWLGGE